MMGHFVISGNMEKTDALRALSALGHEGRLDVFRLLVASNDGLHAGEIAARLDMLPNTLSAHLASLVAAGLIVAERESRHIRYRAHMEGMRGLLAFLMEDCCGGQPELCAPVLKSLACGC
jgi:ArsR family transcriptional regulator, arsenate/arsenite/antimonite-responsive transcriptional repressor